jgi:multicomponent Na+:H+ antiporter subunit F
MTVVFVVAGVLLALSAALTLARLVRGPSTLDRVVATDTLLAIVVCGLATLAAFRLDSTTVPVLVVLSLLGFVGSAGVARLLGQDREP